MRAFLSAAGLPVEFGWTEGPGHATGLAVAAARAGFGQVAAMGGDGTLHEVINGLAETDPQPVLGVIPAGTGNDFARSLGIPLDPLQAAGVVTHGCERCIDLGRVNGRYFVNVGGVGFDAEVAAMVNRGPHRGGGAWPYVVSLFRVLATYRNAMVRIRLDGEQSFKEKILLVAVGNARSYGGGMKVVPHALVDDGLLDVCIGGDLNPVQTLGLLPKVFAGTHLGHPMVRSLRARKIEVESEQSLSVHADGETVGVTPAVFEVVPGRLRVRVDTGKVGDAFDFRA